MLYQNGTAKTLTSFDNRFQRKFFINHLLILFTKEQFEFAKETLNFYFLSILIKNAIS